jgi:hypothetical protein
MEQNAPVESNFVAEPTYVEAPIDNAVTNNNSATTDIDSADEIISLIGKLAKLKESGAITEQDFNNKKEELLARI